MSSTYHTGYGSKSAVSGNAAEKKPKANQTDPQLSAEKKNTTERKAKQRIDKCMAALRVHDDYEKFIRDLQEENERLRKEGETTRNVASAYKRELEEFRAEFAKFRFQNLVPETPNDDDEQSQKMDEN